ncbi:hypothetical protein CEXT_118111 [Caerostris extrusa]|uniref:Uncharacterized protein n=1 Tax=Caerostris extrusa TaxID=172846 RepID=A0AAV4XQE2_CAEEX|nr:hypothetical protein CEXT_118111 [Caerostris extrusa]
MTKRNGPLDKEEKQEFSSQLFGESALTVCLGTSEKITKQTNPLQKASDEVRKKKVLKKLWTLLEFNVKRETYISCEHKNSGKYMYYAMTSAVQ